MAAADITLAEQLGVSPDVIKSFRQRVLAPGVDFVVTGQVVSFTPAGVDRIHELLKIEKKEPPSPPPTTEPPDAPETALLLIVRLHPNPIWVAVKLSRTERQNVRVKHSKGLRLGQRLRCQLVDGTWHCIHRGYAPKNLPRP